MKVSILMLTHNAPKYVKESIETLHNNTSKKIDYELIVVDNASRFYTKLLLKYLKHKKYIDKLHFNKENYLFAKGNNIASELAADDSDLLLLLNSDVSIKHPEWLDNLVKLHPIEGGISSYGCVLDDPIRADGYCLLINKSLYMKYKLDENFAWFWGVTKLESKLLKEGKRIIAVNNHERMIHHYGGKSGGSFKNAAGMGIDIEEVKKWFDSNKIDIIDTI